MRQPKHTCHERNGDIEPWRDSGSNERKRGEILTYKTANTQTGPKRIQRKRSKGWRMPEGAVSVTRPGKFGNPFWHLQRFASLDAALRAFRMAANGYWSPDELKDVSDGPFHVACQNFSAYQKKFSDGPVESIRRELRGKDLACWCHLCERHKDGKPFGEHCDECAPCHADITGEIANAKDSL